MDPLTPEQKQKYHNAGQEGEPAPFGGLDNFTNFLGTSNGEFREAAMEAWREGKNNTEE
jgi:hypothetical protein